MPNPNPLRELLHLGQSVWIDQIQRDWFASGQLTTWIAEDGLRGVTSNPSIFQAALNATDAYDEQLAELAGQRLTAPEIYDQLTLYDIRAACDVFRPVYDQTGGADGFVSHEVTPRLAYDTWGTIHEARRLWSAVDRPNVMIKIPATEEGLPAVRKCLAEGINVNITLMFSQAHYDAVAEAYLGALEDRVAADLPIHDVASVASFFVSRVDNTVDGILDARLAAGGAGSASERAELEALRGRAAVANSKRAYRRFRELFDSPRFSALEVHGARRQRVLWASTSTKDPAYSDVKYVDELIGPHTVNTLPLKTYKAFGDHGRAAVTVTDGLADEDAVVGALGAIGIDLGVVGDELSRKGVESFANALEGALETVEAKRQAVAGA